MRVLCINGLAIRLSFYLSIFSSTKYKVKTDIFKCLYCDDISTYFKCAYFISNNYKVCKLITSASAFSYRIRQKTPKRWGVSFIAANSVILDAYASYISIISVN